MGLVFRLLSLLVGARRTLVLGALRPMISSSIGLTTVDKCSSASSDLVKVRVRVRVRVGVGVGG